MRLLHKLRDLIERALPDCLLLSRFSKIRRLVSYDMQLDSKRRVKSNKRQKDKVVVSSVTMEAKKSSEFFA